MNSLLLKFENAVAGYGIAHSIPPIDIEIHEGEHAILVGENEKRKAEFMDAVAGKISIPKGRLYYHFSDNYCKADIKKPIASVLARHDFKSLDAEKKFYYQQRYNSSDSENSETVSEYLAKIKSFRKKPYWTIPKVVKRLNLKPLEDEALIKLSNGETRKVLLAAALLKNPAILLLDNPMTGLDKESRAFFNSLIPDISYSGVTIIMNSSELDIPEEIEKAIIFKNNQPIQKVKTREAEGYLQSEEALNIPKDDLEKLMQHNHTAYESIIKMNDVKVKYGSKLILDHINWTVKQGERWALTGRNGAGKSTLLSLINGDNPQAYANEIFLFDKKKGSGESIWDLKAKIGFVSPELFQYFPRHLTCGHVIATAFYLRMVSIPALPNDRKEKILQWMNLFNIDQYFNEKFYSVSINIQRLCLLARALITNPVLLILDEPFQGFTHNQKMYHKKIIDTICEQSDITLIFVSHYEEEIPESVTNTIRLIDGKQA
ncbi:ATP-binding cassette domain-containing protein [Fulvivirga maritima]|uniref:ATP-binding cassette domain-containing protein n=1 Tax=Fulvivirga maritima TaxID=2904247 RepID=UPI001F2B7FFD|nr:ATP-binding cassette domain-containing protein [Fulvivirga maritima]UII28077.1 ATP-binding cassette domain-containing protein [Fulvivirga maritima]